MLWSWLDFSLPFMAARKLGSSIEANMTPKIAAGIGILTILLLLLATYALLSALRKAPSNQRVSAPEVARVKNCIGLAPRNLRPGIGFECGKCRSRAARPGNRTQR